MCKCRVRNAVGVRCGHMVWIMQSSVSFIWSKMLIYGHVQWRVGGGSTFHNSSSISCSGPSLLPDIVQNGCCCCGVVWKPRNIYHNLVQGSQATRRPQKNLHCSRASSSVCSLPYFKIADHRFGLPCGLFFEFGIQLDNVGCESIITYRLRMYKRTESCKSAL